ncbi:MAG TPA: hybrid sensor histidine kinase/response regulator [Kofleriaceae bacterium]|nr:hybrid sensor histidine kinase/response regulator [Kofleriaceae bacterium]
MSLEPPARVLVLAPRGRDGELIRVMLAHSGVVVATFNSPEALAVALDEDAGCAIATLEAIGDSFDGALGRVLREQPAWSDVPMIMLAQTRDAEGVPAELGNITILARPIAPNTLLTTVRAALRARRRQWASRAEIRQRDQFLAMLGHELRNPLGSIVMATDLIGLDDDRQSRAKRLAILSRQAHHLARLVDDLLDVARITTGKVRLQREPLSLDELVRAGVDAFIEAAKARAIALDIVATSGAVVDGDPVRLAQVITNLVGNALKYSPNGRTIELGTWIDNGQCELRVVDHGIGIDPNMLGHVFELFTQADAGLARSDGGMGIGLTLVERLVRLHGGTVEALSEGRDLGSRFVVRLPLSHAQPQPAVHTAQRREAGAPVRAVVIEDSTDLRELSVSLLEAIGCEVEAAATGPEGLALIQRVVPEIAIVDIGLPGMTGFEIARVVRQTTTAPIVLVAVTGYGRKEDRDEALAAGFDLHFAKPVQAGRLREVIERVRAERAA